MQIAIYVPCPFCEQTFRDEQHDTTEVLRQLYFHLMGEDHQETPIEERRLEFRRSRVRKATT